MLGLVTDYSQLCISPWECILHVTIKLCINFEVPSFLRSPQLLCVLRGSSVVNGVFYVRNLVCLSPGSLLASLEVPHPKGVSRAFSEESKRTFLVPECSQWCISCQECSMHATRKFCINFEVSSLFSSTKSPRSLQSVFQGV